MRDMSNVRHRLVITEEDAHRLLRLHCDESMINAILDPDFMGEACLLPHGATLCKARDAWSVVGYPIEISNYTYLTN